jgi:hypothetical protein
VSVSTLLHCLSRTPGSRADARIEVWDVPQAIEYMKVLEPIKPWFIEEPTAPDDAVGHATIRKALKPLGIQVATGEHAHNRVSVAPAHQAVGPGIPPLTHPSSSRNGSGNPSVTPDPR